MGENRQIVKEKNCFALSPSQYLESLPLRFYEAGEGDFELQKGKIRNFKEGRKTEIIGYLFI